MGQSDRRKRFSIRGQALIACVLLASTCLFISPSAQAASRQAQEREARKACLSGDYPKGVTILSDLFVDTKDPTFIFNQGRCFEQNRRYDDAIGRFQEYLRAGTRLNNSDKASAANGKYFRDIVSGSNGGCYFFCDARKRYDYVTGLGSPLTIHF